MGRSLYNGLGLKSPNTAVPIPNNTAGPFSNLQPYLYWSQSSAGPTAGNYTFSYATGWQGANTLPNLRSSPFTVQAQALSPSFFVLNGGPHMVAQHSADNSLVGPASLYPEQTTPAKPSETVVLYAGGVAFTQFQEWSSNMYWRTDGGFAGDAKAFAVQPSPGTGGNAPCSGTTSDYSFYTFAGWQQQVGEDLQSVVQNPGFNNPAYPADDYSLPNGSPGVGFVVFEPSQAGRSQSCDCIRQRLRLRSQQCFSIRPRITRAYGARCCSLKPRWLDSL